jgi:hypothetical protein
MELERYSKKSCVDTGSKSENLLEQRRKIKWVKLGNENTKFFHTKATINYRHNFISILENDEHAEVSDHEGKAAILWKAFKERMGKSDRSNMLFNVH